MTPIRPALCPAGFRRRRQSKPKVNKGPVACAACTKPSAFLKKQDFHGYDLHKGIANVESAAACCKKCKENPGCKYWTYGTQAPMKGTCWLKQSSSGHEAQANRESGRVCRQVACSKCAKPSTFLEKQDFHGYDLHKGIANVESAAACCKKCKENPGCKYWTYGTQAPMKGTCWLKHSNDGPMACAINGATWHAGSPVPRGMWYRCRAVCGSRVPYS